MSAMPAEAGPAPDPPPPVPGVRVSMVQPPVPRIPAASHQAGVSRPARGRRRSASARPHPAAVRSCSPAARAEQAGAVPQAPAQPATASHLLAPQPVAPVAAARDAAAVPRAHAADSTRLRLTTRGRVVLIACAAIVASLLGLALATAARASNPGMPPRPAGHAVSQMVVQPGQTLWSIAAQADPTTDPRLVIQQIIKANALTGENLTAGQHLWVPRS